MRRIVATIVTFFILSAVCVADQWPVLAKTQSSGHWPIKTQIKNKCPGGKCPIKVNPTKRRLLFRGVLSDFRTSR